MMDIDQLILKLEDDLAALRRARDLARQYEGGSPLNGKANHGALIGEQQTGGGAWHSQMPEMLRDKAMSVREIETALGSKGLRVAYSTIHSWMKRSVARGDFKKKGGKYRWQEAKDQPST